MLKGFGRGQPGARGVDDGGMGVVLWWKKREVAKEFAAARGGGSGVVLYGTNGGTEVRKAGQAFFLPAFDLRLVGMMRSAKGRGGKKQKNTLGLF